MILAFRVSNFKAFRHPQEINLHRIKPHARAKDGGGSWDVNVTPVAAVYGANASGKSTLIKALRFFKSAVRDSYRKWEIDGPTGVTPFLLSEDQLGQPSEFEIEFRNEEGTDFQYGFALDRDAIVSEWLYAYRTSNRTVIFERNVDSGSEFYFGNTFRGARKQIEENIRARPNALILSTGSQLGNEQLQEVYRWIVRNLRTFDARAYESGHRDVIRRIENDENYGRKLAAVLAKADLGVCEIKVHEQPVDQEIFETTIRLMKVLDDDLSEDRLRKKSIETNKTLRLSHSVDSEKVEFPISWESDGTRALISFTHVAISALDDGAVLVIDELDTSLHPLLVAELVALFQDKATNPNQAQLILTTHDTGLLGRRRHDRDLLERDQVWITEKSSDGSASLIALSEYKPRREENLERGYLTGRFGGIPHLGLFDAFQKVAQKTEDFVS